MNHILKICDSIETLKGAFCEGMNKTLDNDYQFSISKPDEYFLNHVFILKVDNEPMSNVQVAIIITKAPHIKKALALVAALYRI